MYMHYKNQQFYKFDNIISMLKIFHDNIAINKTKQFQLNITVKKQINIEKT